ncbi:MAG: hypothetical protein HQL67_07390 [Magnetococcales bacterium]|nr:hypothetical protein [Magnetococcales bacterium]
MLPINSTAISGVTNDLEDRANYQANIQQIRAHGSQRVSPVRRAQPNHSADDVQQERVNPDRKKGGSGHLAASYEAIVNEVQEEEQLRLESHELEVNSRREEILNSPPLSRIGFTKPSVIVSRRGPSRSVAKLFVQMATAQESPFQSVAPSNRVAARVDVTI